MPLDQLSDADLLASQQDALRRAHAARAEGDADRAARIVDMFLRPMNAEMALRLSLKRAA